MPLLGNNTYLRTTGKSPLHRHVGCIEVLYCRRGVCEYESCGRIYRLMPGQVFVSRPNEPHEMLSDPNGQSTYYFLFRLRGRKPWDWEDEELRFIEGKLRNLPRVFDGDKIISSSFAQLIRTVGSELEEGVERRFRVRMGCMNLLLAIIDAAGKIPAAARSSLIHKIAEEMREHPERAYSIEELVARTGFSSSSILSAFKATTGYTPHAYLVKCRIDKAKELLRSGTMKVTDISHSLGFPSSQHFAAQFRKFTGASPKAWAKANCM